MAEKATIEVEAMGDKEEEQAQSRRFDVDGRGDDDQ